MYCCRVGLRRYFCQGIKDAILLLLSKNSSHSDPETQPSVGGGQLRGLGVTPPAKTGSAPGKLKKLFVTI